LAVGDAGTSTKGTSTMCCHAMPSCSKPARWCRGAVIGRTPTPTASARTWSVPAVRGRFGASVLSSLGVVSCDLTTW